MIILRPPLKKQVHKIKVERIVLRRQRSIALRKQSQRRSGLLSAALEVRNSIVHGFAQLASLGLTSAPNNVLIRSENDAIRADWVKIGSDMEEGIRRAQALEEADPKTAS